MYGNGIKKLRENSGNSRKDLAQAVSVSQETVRLWEQNKHKIKHNHMLALADFFKIAPAEFTAKVQSISSGTNNSPATGLHSDFENPETPVLENNHGCEFRHIGLNKTLALIPLVDYHLYGSYLSFHSNQQYLSTLPRHPIIIENKISGVYRAFRVNGDNMDNDSKQSLIPGHIVVGHSIDPATWSSKINTHKYLDYVIAHKQEGILIRRITNHNVDEGIIECSSLNPSYQNFSLKLSDVLELYNIIEVNRKLGY